MDEATARAQSMLSESMAVGQVLSERWSKIPGKSIRGYSKHKSVDFLEGIDDPTKRATLAILFENTLNWLQGLEETTRMVAVGSYEKFIFPIIRAVYANLVASDLVTVQPLTTSTGLVFYFDVLYGSQKGNIPQGGRMFNALTGPTANYHYSDEVIEEEAFATGSGIAAYAATLAYTPIRAGTFRLTDGTQTVGDDGNGALTGNGAGTVNYATGLVNVAFTAVVANGTAITATYEYNMEANTNIPEVDLVLTSSPVTARSQKLRARWSIESQQDLQSYHGINAEVELVAFMANEIAKELNYKIVRHLAQIAAAGTVTWSRTPPAGVPWIWHKESFYDTLVAGSNAIFSATQRRQGNWIVADVTTCNVIEILDKFKPQRAANENIAGIRKIGTIGEFAVYKDPTLAAAAAANGTFLMGYKGNTFLDTGYIWAPYLGLYTTPTVTLDDFISRKGMAQRTGLKVVNSLFYLTGTVTP